MKKFLFTTIIIVWIISFAKGYSHAKEKLEPLPEINFVTMTAEQYMSQYEMANFVAEAWRRLGLHVKMNPAVYPNPMLSIWFKEHKFDAVCSVYTSLPTRLEPDFFTNAKFHSARMTPGDWNAGEYKNPEFDRIGEEQTKIYDPEKRRELIYRLQEIIYEDQPESVIAYSIDTYGMNTSRFDIDYVPSVEGITSIWNYLRVYPKGADRLLKIGKFTDQMTWNPVAAVQSGDFMQLRLLYDTLVQVGPDGSVKMWAAENVKPVSDTTIEAVLRKGMKFHDGKPVTAEDVKFSYEYMKKWQAPYFLKYLEPVKDIELVGKDKLRFHLNRPYAPFIMNTLGQVYILPMHIWKDIPEKVGLRKPQDYRNVPPIGSGMYKMDYWKEGQEFKYFRNTDHFMSPKVDTLTIVFGSAELQMSALKKGTIDISFQEIIPVVVKELEKEKNIRLFQAQAVGYTGIVYHCGKPPFNDRKLRAALSYAIPYEKIIDEVLMGNGGRSVATIMPVNAFWYNNNLKPTPFDLEKARSILKEAGYRWDDQGRLCYPAR